MLYMPRAMSEVRSNTLECGVVLCTSEKYKVVLSSTL